MNFVEAFVLGDVSQAINRIAHELAQEGTKSTHKKTHATRVKEQNKVAKALRETFQKSFDQYHERMKHGMDLLAHGGLLGKIDPTKVISAITSLHSPEPSTEIVQHKMGISDDTLVSFHECAAAFFEKKDFESAADVFLVLTFLNPFVPSFWTGLGMSEELRLEFDGAALAFLMAAELSEDGYAWAIRGAECFHKAHKTEQAQAVLDAVIKETGTSPKYVQVKQAAMTAKKACMYTQTS